MDPGPSIAGLPRSRGERAAWLVGIASVAVAIVLTMLTHHARWILAASVVVALCTFGHYRAWIGAKARLRRHRWKLCDRCRYPLDRLPAEGTCPECGQPYRHDLVAARWRTAYATYWKDPVEVGTYEITGDDHHDPANRRVEGDRSR